MFWAKRLKSRGDDSSWAVPFGDLMSLLLVIFVMIAAMNELRPGRGFDHVGKSMQNAFGRRPAMASGNHAPVVARPADLREWLEAGLSHAATFRLADASDELLPPCEVVGDSDRLTIRVAAADSFIGPTGVVQPRTRKLLAALADQLREGHARLEVRGYGADGGSQPALPYQDALDLAAERARAVCRELIDQGVAESRLVPAACAHPAGGRGFDIDVHASPATPAGKAKPTQDGGMDG